MCIDELMGSKDSDNTRTVQVEGDNQSFYGGCFFSHNFNTLLVLGAYRNDFWNDG